jgi:hypothetical protein
MQKLLNGKNNPMLPSDVQLCSARCRARGRAVSQCRHAKRSLPHARREVAGRYRLPRLEARPLFPLHAEASVGVRGAHVGHSRAAWSTSGAPRRWHGAGLLDVYAIGGAFQGIPGLFS